MPAVPPRILAFGDNVVDCYRDQGLMYPGGNCVNHAVFARRFGARTWYAGAVADDPAGRLLRDALTEEGVDVSLLRFLLGDTAYCVIARNNGERTFEGANLGVSIVAPSPADLKQMADVDAVHTGRSSHIESWLPHIAELTKLSYDFATNHPDALLAEVAPHCYLASFSGKGLSVGEASVLARRARAFGAVWALVTLGEEGALLAGPESETRVSAQFVTPKDTLGAGDTFIARTLVGLLRGEAPAELLKAAAAAASETCLTVGGFGHPAPMVVDLSTVQGIDEIYRTTRPAPPPLATVRRQVI